LPQQRKTQQQPTPPHPQDKPVEHKHDGMVNITPPPVYKLRFFTQEEFETVAVLVDLIIPRTDTPGARDAKVHQIIDAGVRPQRRDAWRSGLALMDRQAREAEGKPFREAGQETQVRLLRQASAAPKSDAGSFFTLLKDATIDAYYSTREGLVQELGWSGNTFLPEFKGCTHPEHQG
jgi:hypothetical protein